MAFIWHKLVFRQLKHTAILNSVAFFSSVLNLLSLDSVMMLQLDLKASKRCLFVQVNGYVSCSGKISHTHMGYHCTSTYFFI